MLRGIDCSSLQGRISWDEVAAAGIRFAYLRAGGGSSAWIDPLFGYNLGRCRANRIWAGAYFSTSPLPGGTPGTGHDPVEQANHHFHAAGGYGMGPGELPPMADLELPEPKDWASRGCTPGQIVAWHLPYLREADRLWKGPVGIYTFPDWYNRLLPSIRMLSQADRDFLAARPFWAADYKTRNALPTPDLSPWVPEPWGTNKGQLSGSGLSLWWSFWQYGQITMPGTKGQGPIVDADIFYGTESELETLAGGPA